MSLKEDGEIDIELPDFDIIKRFAIKKIEQNFEKYGNSWKYNILDTRFWNDRLEGEVLEVKETKNPYDEMEELIDVINIAAMRFDNLREKFKIG